MDECMMYGIGDRIYKAIKDAGMTQREVAARLNVCEKTVSRWTCGVKLIRLSNLIQLAEVLNVSPGYILFGEQN